MYSYYTSLMERVVLVLKKDIEKVNKFGVKSKLTIMHCMVAIKLNNWTQVGDARKTPMQTTTMATTTSITASTLTTAVVAKKWKSNNCKNSYINSHNSG